MIESIMFAVWFFLPAAVANVTPILIAQTPSLKKFNQPLDFGSKINGKRVFGPNKTIRGMIAGIIASTIVLIIQQSLASNIDFFDTFSEKINYLDVNVWILGPLFGLGALGGDAVESFFKRQLNIQPGKSWVPFDQIDYIVGASIATLAFVNLSVFDYVLILIIWTLAHLASSYIGFILKIKDSPI